MTSSEDATETIAGSVKWFDPVKGYGFVIPDSGGSDILLHANVLRSFGRNSVAERSRIEIVVQNTPRGMQAIEVLSIEPAEETESPMYEVRYSEEEYPLNEIVFEPARVKWFDSVKGFGFVNVFGDYEDVFVHIETVRKSGLIGLQLGEAVAVKVVQGERGSMAAQIAGWEAALEEEVALEEQVLPSSSS